MPKGPKILYIAYSKFSTLLGNRHKWSKKEHFKQKPKLGIETKAFKKFLLRNIKIQIVALFSNELVFWRIVNLPLLSQGKMFSSYLFSLTTCLVTYNFTMLLWDQRGFSL